VKIFKEANKNFEENLNFFLNKRYQDNSKKVDNSVKKIIKDVVNRGDEALFEYAKNFDNTYLTKDTIRLSKELLLSFKDKVDLKIMEAFRVAIKNITNFHIKQKPNNYEVTNEGVRTQSVWKPIDSVGLYIPGGKAVYPSSLIMNVVPAKVAGVKRIAVVTPSKSDQINPYILALLSELEIKEVYKVGGAHSIAALAYGTDSIKQVNKIFGPGNAYVSSAKKQVFGRVGIDILAGPSEIVVVANIDNNPIWVAADLIAQAEHDEKAQSILITDDESFANKVLNCLDELSKNLPKASIIKSSLKNYGAIIIAENIDKSHKIINKIAPEHLHLHIKSSQDILSKINNAGGIFVGEFSTEAFGDYIVGTNHILPTSGSAKFSSGVGVIDFMKRSSIVHMNKDGYNANQENVIKMAEIEQLEGHKLSVKIRQTEKK
jgi:histidinol dehydrogenase